MKLRMVALNKSSLFFQPRLRQVLLEIECSIHEHYVQLPTIPVLIGCSQDPTTQYSHQRA